MELLRANNLSYSYDYTLFENVNLVLKKAQSCAILGVSGCGKSTLLHILSTLLKPQCGEVIYNNKQIYSLKDFDLTNIRRNDFGIIFQSHYLFKGFSAMENVEIATVLSNQEIDLEIFEKLKIKHLLQQNVGELSGGQQQRVSVVRVLSKKPRVIFADEPTGNLDKETANEVMNVLFDYVKQNDAGLVLVTHDNELAQRCDDLYKLENRQFSRWN